MMDWLPLVRDLPLLTREVLEGATLLGACAGVVGCFAFLRRRSLTGDALAHAALPGLCAGWLLAGERDFSTMLAGAFVTGLLSLLVISLIGRYTRLKEDAAIGMALSVFFGAGIVLNSLIQNLPTGNKAGLASFILGQSVGMEPGDVQWIRLLSLTLLLVVALLFKELRLIAFDAGFARAQGWPTLALDLLLMVLIAVAVTTGLPMVGVMLMAALLILPAAAARFWTDKLAIMLILSACFGMAAAIGGTLVSNYFGAWPTGPTIILAGTAIFLGSILLAPRRGGLARWLARRRLQFDLHERQLLRSLYHLAEPHLPSRTALAVADLQRQRSWSAARLEQLLAHAVKQGWARFEGAGHVLLTPAGLRRAGRAARGARLWELALRQYPEIAPNLASLDTEIEEVLPAEVLHELTGQLKKQGRLPEVGEEPEE